MTVDDFVVSLPANREQIAPHGSPSDSFAGCKAAVTPLYLDTGVVSSFEDH